MLRKIEAGGRAAEMRWLDSVAGSMGMKSEQTLGDSEGQGARRRAAARGVMEVRRGWGLGGWLVPLVIYKFFTAASPLRSFCINGLLKNKYFICNAFLHFVSVSTVSTGIHLKLHTEQCFPLDFVSIEDA